MTRKTKGQADETDIKIGRNIRTARQLRNWTQERLAEAIDVTFQQVQKYEKGMNRVSGSRLLTLANVLEVPLSVLLAEVEDCSGYLTLPPDHPAPDRHSADAGPAGKSGHRKSAAGHAQSL